MSGQLVIVLVLLACSLACFAGAAYLGRRRQRQNQRRKPGNVGTKDKARHD